MFMIIMIMLQVFYVLLKNVMTACIANAQPSLHSLHNVWWFFYVFIGAFFILGAFKKEFSSLFLHLQTRSSLLFRPSYLNSVKCLFYLQRDITINLRAYLYLNF